jgi:hypothetical protein
MPSQRKKPAAIGTKAPYPGFIETALATSVDKVPSGQRWIHEVKFDGYRVQVHLRDAVVKVFTRRGNDWTNRFRKIAAYAWHINAGSAIIDGEVVVPSADGTSDFSVLQNEPKGRSTKIVMVAFDLLYLNGYDLRKLPLLERKKLLKKIIADIDVQFSESFEVDGREMYNACSIGLEGVVSKVRDSRYISGGANSWVKKTCAQRETLPVERFVVKLAAERASLSHRNQALRIERVLKEKHDTLTLAELNSLDRRACGLSMRQQDSRFILTPRPSKKHHFVLKSAPKPDHCEASHVLVPEDRFHRRNSRSDPHHVHPLPRLDFRRELRLGRAQRGLEQSSLRGASVPLRAGA